MVALRNGNASECLRLLMQAQDLLSKAESIVSEHNKTELVQAKAVTASNLGIYYKRSRNYREAVACLRLALELHEGGTDLRTVVAAHLNLCVCFLHAEIGDEALRHALKAVELE